MAPNTENLYFVHGSYVCPCDATKDNPKGIMATSGLVKARSEAEAESLFGRASLCMHVEAELGSHTAILYSDLTAPDALELAYAGDVIVTREKIEATEKIKADWMRENADKIEALNKLPKVSTNDPEEILNSIKGFISELTGKSVEQLDREVEEEFNVPGDEPCGFIYNNGNFCDVTKKGHERISASPIGEYYSHSFQPMGAQIAS